MAELDELEYEDGTKYNTTDDDYKQELMKEHMLLRRRAYEDLQIIRFRLKGPFADIIDNKEKKDLPTFDNYLDKYGEYPPLYETMEKIIKENTRIDPCSTARK